MTPPPLDAPDFTRRYLNLADPRLGAEAVSASDDFFAPKERMLNPEPATLFRVNTMNIGNGWTGGRLAGNGWRATIGALCGLAGRA